MTFLPCTALSFHITKLNQDSFKMLKFSHLFQSFSIFIIRFSNTLSLWFQSNTTFTYSCLSLHTSENALYNLLQLLLTQQTTQYHLQSDFSLPIIPHHQTQSLHPLSLDFPHHSYHSKLKSHSDIIQPCLTSTCIPKLSLNAIHSYTCICYSTEGFHTIQHLSPYPKTPLTLPRVEA